jgi:hypothetical protein
MVSEIDIMPGGSNSLKPGQPRSTNINTVQTGNYLSKNVLH